MRCLTRVVTIATGLALIANTALSDEDTNYDGVPDVAGQLLAEKFAPAFFLQHVPEESVLLEPEPVEILGSGPELTINDLWVTQFDLNSSNYETYPWSDSRNPLYGEVLRLADVLSWYQDTTARRYVFNLEFGQASVPGQPSQETYTNWQATYQARGPVFDPVVYARLFNNGDGTGAIEYWMYYPFNQWANNHEGDWERIRVTISTLDPLYAQVVSVLFFFHKSSLEIGSDTVLIGPDTVQLLQLLPLVGGTHPIVYVGGHGEASNCDHPQQGDHSGGSYPAPGTWVAVAQSCPEWINEMQTPGKYIAPHEVQIRVMPNASSSMIPENSPYWDAHPDMAWTNASVYWGAIFSPSAGTGVCSLPVAAPSPCFNRSPRPSLPTCVRQSGSESLM